MSQVVPILRILDVPKAMEFYRDFLGFTVDWEHRFDPSFPLYAQVSRNDVLLHLSEHHGEGTPGAHVRIEIPDLDAYHAALLAKEYRYSRPGLNLQPWGERNMSIADPFGNRVTFYKAIEQGADGNPT